MNDGKKQNVIINITYIALVGCLVYLVIRYALYWFMPFLLGFFIASLLKPVIRKLHAATKLSKRFLAMVTLLIFYSVALGIIIFVSVKFFVWFRHFILTLPMFYYQVLEPQLMHILHQLSEQFAQLDSTFLQTLNEFSQMITGSLASAFTSFSTHTFLALSRVVTSLPSVLTSLFIMVLSSIFFTLDYQKIVNFMMRQATPRIQELILALRYYFFENCVGYVKAYFILMVITFGELYIGFHVLDLDHAFGYAFGIALFDMLPVLGCGGILIPWFIICFLLGMKKLAVGLVILYLIVTLVHNFMEPKLVGKQVGLHPLVLLLAMFIGGRFFGILGFLLFPFFMSVLKSLHDQGYIRLFR